MQCSEFKLRISEYIDGELSEKEQKAVLKHIEECESCRKLLDTYKSLSQNIKEDIPQIPKDFKVILPKKRKNIFTLIRGHEGLISAVAAAAALMIFAGGIEKDVYKAPVMEEEKVLPKTEILAMPKAEMPMEVPKTESREMVKATSAPVTESNAEIPEPSEVSKEVKEPQMASVGGASARILVPDETLAVAESGISGFVMPPKEEFENEEIYESLLEKLEILRERELNGEDVKIEFEQLLTEIENSKG